MSEIPVEELVRRQHPGWLVPYMIRADEVQVDVPPEVVAPGKLKGARFTYFGHGRWEWWLSACAAGRIPETPIPVVRFGTKPDPNDAKVIRDLLKPVIWKGWGGYDDAWMDLVRWILHGLNYRPAEMEVERISPDIRATWYTQFNIFTLLHSPCDWSAVVLQHGLPGDKPRSSSYTGSGYFSTPMNVCKLMTSMTMGYAPTEAHKYQSVCDPCCGTGSMLLPASNYSLRLYGTDIVYDLTLCSILNGYLWMPWLVYMPTHMRELLEAGRPDQAGIPTGVEYATDPERVAQVTAIREAAARGELVQMPML